MGEFPSGQRGQTVNLLAMPSMVRIHLPPPKIPITRLGGRYFSLRGRWSRSLSPSGEIHLPPPKIPITRLGGRYFLCLLPAGTFGPCAAFHSRGRLASPSLAPPLLRRFGRSRLYAPSHPRCAQPRGQLPAGQTAHERVKTVGTYRQPAAHARPQIRLGPRRQRRKTHLASPHLRSPFLS